jgi:formate dehydrogenase subunit gamma
MPGSDARTATARRRAGYVRRFSRTERTLHWVNAAFFFCLLASGLVLYLPTLAEQVGRRPLVKDVHLYTGLAWIPALVLLALAGDRRGVLRVVDDAERFDRDDLRWLALRRAPQGRFNAGQKLNLALTAAFTCLFALSGTLLWLGERDTRFRLAGTIALHDGLVYLSLVLLLGHLYLAVLHPATRHALRGITRGTVRSDWAATHHAKWAPEDVSTRR